MAEPVQVNAGGYRWLVAAGQRELLLGPDGLRLAEWLSAGQAQVVKQAPHRTIYRVTLPGLHFYLKHYPLAGVRSWLRGLVRPSKARVEYDRALAVAGRGVPTVIPLAVGERPGPLPGASFLLTRSLDDHEPLNTFVETTFQRLDRGGQARTRQRLAAGLGRLVARMHDAGMTHHDLHTGNLLVGLDANQEPLLHVIDLPEVRLGRSLGWRARRANLVLLNRWFVLRASRTDRLRFWRAYWGAWKDPGDVAPGLKFAALARDLERRTWESNEQFWRGSEARCLGTNRYFRRVRSATAAGHAVTDLDPGTLADLLADPDEPFRRPGVRLLKDSRSSTVAELDLTVGGKTRRVIYKRFRVTAWSDPWTALVRSSPALRSWRNGHGLSTRGLPTPRPLAVFHRRRGGLPREGYLLTEKVNGAQDLHAFLAGLNDLPAADRRARLRCLIDQVARLVRELHRRRLSHRDLKAANVLVAPPEPPAGAQPAGRFLPLGPLLFPGLWLIDLVGVTRPRELKRSRRVQNLARLHASFVHDPALTRTDKLRFLRTYMQWHLRGKSTWKRWWRAVEQTTRAKVARNLRNGRPLA